jgi:hypothetical protein
VKKITLIIIMVALTFINLYGCSSSASKSDLKKLITNEFTKGNDHNLAIREEIIDISNIEIGPVQNIEERDYYANTRTIKQVQSYEATIKSNCINRLSNKVEGTYEDRLSGEISRDKMGRFQATGINSYKCRQYQYGCAAGNCTTGLGIQVYKNNGSEWCGCGGCGRCDEDAMTFMGRFKDGKKVWGVKYCGNSRPQIVCETGEVLVQTYDGKDHNEDVGIALLEANLISKEEYEQGVNTIEYWKKRKKEEQEEESPANK